MKTILAFLSFLLLFVSSACGAAPPLALKNAKLTSNMNGNGYAITNLTNIVVGGVSFGQLANTNTPTLFSPKFVNGSSSNLWTTNMTAVWANPSGPSNGIVQFRFGSGAIWYDLKANGFLFGVAQNGVFAYTNFYFGPSNHLAPGRALSLRGNVGASNIVFSPPRWNDEKVSGITFSASPSGNPPSRVEVEGGTGIYGLAWEHNDTGDFSIQFSHGTASTNAGFPDYYYSPHLHVSTKTLPANTSNATFRISYQICPVSGSYSNTIVTLTNTVTFPNTSAHVLMSFGTVTNNLLQGRDSVVARGSLTRLAGPAGDVGNTAIVFVDSMDFHIPIDTIGSTARDGDAP